MGLLEVDIPAFRAGYDKEWYYKRLKKLPLADDQTEQLRNIRVRAVRQQRIQARR